MGCNVWLSFFKSYDTAALKRLEYKYFLACYGLPFIPALIYLFVNTVSRGRIYGSALVFQRRPCSQDCTDICIALVLGFTRLGLPSSCNLLRTGLDCHPLHDRYLCSSRHRHIQVAQATLVPRQDRRNERVPRHGHHENIRSHCDKR